MRVKGHIVTHVKIRAKKPELQGRFISSTSCCSLCEIAAKWSKICVTSSVEGKARRCIGQDVAAENVGGLACFNGTIWMPKE